MKENVIAIDGPAASGKSTAARKLAEKLNIPYISTGAMFRAIAWKAKKKNISLQNPEQIALMLHETVMTYVPKCAGDAPEICIDGIFPGAELRTPEIASGASQVAVYPAVRNYTLKIQRELAEKQLVVMEGRDIGAVVFPNAKYKFFLTASPHARAVRRLSQNGETPAS